MDADMIADLRLEHVEPLTRILGDAFYADAEMMRDAVRRLPALRSAPALPCEALFSAGLARALPSRRATHPATVRCFQQSVRFGGSTTHAARRAGSLYL